MLSCVMCEMEYCFLTSICSDCRRIRHLMNIYSKKSVLNTLEKCLVIEKFKDKEEDAEKEEPGDETYIKPKTRSEKK